MKVAIWIIAICEVVRAMQSFAYNSMIRHDTEARDNAYAEFVKSLKETDRDFVKRLLQEVEAQEEKECQ